MDHHIAKTKKKSELVNVDNPIDTKHNKGSNYPSKIESIEHHWPRSVDVSFLHTTDPQVFFCLHDHL